MNLGGDKQTMSTQEEHRESDKPSRYHKEIYRKDTFNCLFFFLFDNSIVTTSNATELQGS